MTAPSDLMPRPTRRFAGKAAIASGVMGIFSFASLITAFVYIVSLHTDFEKLEDVIVNSFLRSRLSRGLWAIGMIAGFGFVIVGLSFFFLLDLPALVRNPDAYGEDVDFHIGLWTGGIPAFILFPIWAIFFGRNLLRTQPETFHEH